MALLHKEFHFGIILVDKFPHFGYKIRDLSGAPLNPSGSDLFRGQELLAFG